MKSEEIKQPAFLKKGDTICFVSPAGKVQPEYVEKAAQRLKDAGYNIKIAEHALGENYKYSGTDSERLQDLQGALDSDNIGAIVCSRGGYGSMRILDTLSWKGFTKHPKWLIGFSDITALHTAIYNQAFQSIHGMMAKDIAQSSSEAFRGFMELLAGRTKSLNFKRHPMNKTGRTEAVLVGGNLSILYALRGTPWDIDWSGKILFIEEISEHLYHLDRMMQSFSMGGKLSKLSGVILGQFTEMTDTEFGQNAAELISGYTSKAGIPVAMDAPFGHIPDTCSLIHGAKATLNVTKNGTSLTYKH